MCKDCRTEYFDTRAGLVTVDLSGWGTWNIGLDVEPECIEAEYDSSKVFLGVRDALRIAWSLARAAVRLRWLEWRDERHWPKAAAANASTSDGAR